MKTETSIINTLAPNQFWFINQGKIVFQSYNTIICTISQICEYGQEPEIIITEGQPQSTTTAKYLNQFLALHTKYTNYKNII